MSALGAIPLDGLLWLVPVLFALHNAEEAFFFDKRPEPSIPPIHIAIGRRQFILAVTLLTIAGFVLAYVGLVLFPGRNGRWLILGMQVVILVNAVFPHLAATLFFRRYNPGVVTGTALTIPFSYYLLRRALMEGAFSRGQLGTWLAVAPLAIFVLVVLSLGIGKAFAPK